LRILLIDDDLLEQARFSQTISLLQVDYILMQAEDGQVALDILKETKSLPDVILLDLNMPRLNGIEFLKIIKSMPRLKSIPIVAFSTSTNLSDINTCYQLGIASFIHKSLKPKTYTNTIRILINYWSINVIALNKS